jgi:tRNA 2-thiouridine synthesizing protein E
MMNDVQDLKVARDAEGYLIDPEDWTEPVAERIAAEQGIALDEDAWAILRFMREFWSENRVAPDVRHVVDFLVKTRGIDKKAAKELLFNRFNFDYVRYACKIAGMQRPRAWSTG